MKTLILAYGLLLFSLACGLVSAPDYALLIAISLISAALSLGVFGIGIRRLEPRRVVGSAPGIFGCVYALMDGLLRYFWATRVFDLLR